MASADGFDTLFPHVELDPTSDASLLNVPLPGLSEIGWQPSRDRIAISTAEDDDIRIRQRDQRRNRYYGPTYMFSIAQKPFVLSSSTVPHTASDAPLTKLNANDPQPESLTNAKTERSVGAGVNPLTLPPAASPDLVNLFPNGLVGDSCNGVRSPNLRENMDGPSGLLTGELLNLGEISRHFASPQVSPGVGCVEPFVTENAVCDASLPAGQFENSELNEEVDLYCHETFDKDDDFFHLLHGALPGSTLANKPDGSISTTLKSSTNPTGLNPSVGEGKEKPSCGVWRKLRQSKVVAKWWWHLNTEHWRGRSEGGIYVNGELTCAKQVSGKSEPEEGNDGRAGRCSKEDKLGVDDRRKPSRFCHICLRRAERVTAVACHNLCTGRCRKVICKRCFDEYNWDWKEATAKDSQWDCPHCRKEFVVYCQLLPSLLVALIVDFFTPILQASSRQFVEVLARRVCFIFLPMPFF